MQPCGSEPAPRAALADELRALADRAEALETERDSLRHARGRAAAWLKFTHAFCIAERGAILHRARGGGRSERGSLRTAGASRGRPSVVFFVCCGRCGVRGVLEFGETVRLLFVVSFFVVLVW